MTPTINQVREATRLTMSMPTETKHQKMDRIVALNNMRFWHERLGINHLITESEWIAFMSAMVSMTVNRSERVF